MIAQRRHPGADHRAEVHRALQQGRRLRRRPAQFEKEFDEDLSVIAFADREFGLPATLKLSVHSGSDKFSLYPIINRLIKKHGAGLHVKTAGTTWLEELIGLAEAGGEGLAIAKEIYARAAEHFEELVKPYATVLDIDPARLPSPEEVAQWNSQEYVAALRHDQSCPAYNPHFRQFIHVSFKIAAQARRRSTLTHLRPTKRSFPTMSPTTSSVVTSSRFSARRLRLGIAFCSHWRG